MLFAKTGKFADMHLHQFQIKDGFKAARKSATQAYMQYVEEPMTSQRRRRFDMELVLHNIKIGVDHLL